jgi:hypothetical protein
MLRNLSAAFTGGAIGALLASLLFWELSRDGVLAWMGIALSPALSLAWLYPRLVIGGLWGLLFTLPLLPGQPAMRGLLWSLAPSAFMLLHQMPAAGRGLFGLGYGTLTPALILLVNALWGLTASLWYRGAAR